MWLSSNSTKLQTMGPFNKNVMVLLVMFIALWEAQCAFSKVHVNVYNYLEDFNFTIHCKSADDDLGVHVVAPGECYSWAFHVNIWETTLFFCGVNWQGGQRVLDFYRYDRDGERCFTCNWHIKRDGIFGYRNSGQLDLVFEWSKPPK